MLTATLFAAAAVAIVAVSSLVYPSPPPGLARARPYVLCLVGVAVVLLVLEWTLVH